MQLRMPWYYLGIGVVLAGIIHIVAVLSLPALAPDSAWSRLSTLGPANSVQQLPATSDALPMLAPDVRHAFCRFDLSAGPVVLRASVVDHSWMVSLHTPEGGNFYTAAGVDLKRPVVSLVIATPDQRVAETGLDAPEGADETIIVRSPQTSGIAMIRAPLAGPARAAQAEAALKAAYCGPYIGPT
jgi:uncharacterized membrane protein